MRRALAAGLIALTLPTLVTAQTAAPPTVTPAPGPPAPDKSGFTLFDPTPTADLRALCTDRPTKSTSPCTVDAGHMQFESDVINVTVDHSNGLNTTTTLVTNPTIKLGLTNAIDAEANISPYEIVSVRDRATGVRTRSSGVGDLYLRMKWSLVGDDGGNIGFAIVPYLKAPTARTPIGNGAVEGGLIAPISLNLPLSWQLVIDPEVDLLEDVSGLGHHVNASGLLSLSRPVSKTVTVSVEAWNDVNFDPLGMVTQVSADFGLAWMPASLPNCQLDGGVNLGLNSRTPGAQIYIGVSRRFW